MSIGSLVAVPELQNEGPARLLAQKQGFLEIQFLATGAQMTQEARQVVRYALLPQTKIEVQRAGAKQVLEISAEKPVHNKATGRFDYQAIDADGKTLRVDEGEIALVREPLHPADQLKTVHFHDVCQRFARAGTPLPPDPWGPLTFTAREELLSYRDSLWPVSAGVIGLLGARVQALPHQMQVARQALSDRSVRFLLADEVGLGKTIEAGLIMQSLLAIRPTMRILIIVPGALVSQWFLEMFVKFGGRQFTMFDEERLRSYNGNPWVDEQFVIASSHCIEGLKGIQAVRFAQSKWDMIIVDECHRMQPGGPLYKRVSILSKNTPHVLLLSATPARHHADAYLALLHLLQPDVYRLEDMASFQAKWKALDKIEALVKSSEIAEALDADLRKQWDAVFKKDDIAQSHLQAWQDGDEHARHRLLSYVQEHYCLDHRVISHRRKVLAKLAEESGSGDLHLAQRSLVEVPYKEAKNELAARQALRGYQTALIKHWQVKGQIPPRLAHWLLQLELAFWGHPSHADRLLAMREAVLENPAEYEEYQLRAIKGETLAQVLRPDLSESEGMQQIAVSASCHCDPEQESVLLDELRNAVQAWARGTQSKVKALIKRIQDFWDEFPDEKLLIFAGHAIAVREIGEALADEFGEARVCTFGAHQEQLEREETARRFQKDHRLAIMVSDPLGGEGRNFQFVSAVAHYDLPWNIAAVEQRIGRVDRLGRDGDVPSWILYPQDESSLLHAWAKLLADGVRVFETPASGLEFISDGIECDALNTALADGAEAVLKNIPAIRETVDAERAASEKSSESLYSGHNTIDFAAVAELAEKVEQVKAPVRAVCQWVRGMGGQVRREEEGAQQFMLRPPRADDFTEGLFTRSRAMANPELSYFALGHELVDLLVNDAADAQWCRAMCWRRAPQPALKKWEGLRVSFELSLDLGPIAAAKMPLESIRRIYSVAPPRRIVEFFTFPDGELLEDEAARKVLLTPFDSRKGDKTLSPKTSRELWMRSVIDGKLQSIVDWQGRIDQVMALAAQHAEERVASEREAAFQKLQERCERDMAVMNAQAETGVARFGRGHPDTERLREEAEQCRVESEAYLAAVKNAHLSIASVAYVVVA